MNSLQLQKSGTPQQPGSERLKIFSKSKPFNVASRQRPNSKLINPIHRCVLHGILNARVDVLIGAMAHEGRLVEAA